MVLMGCSGHCHATPCAACLHCRHLPAFHVWFTPLGDSSLSTLVGLPRDKPNVNLVAAVSCPGATVRLLTPLPAHSGPAPLAMSHSLAPAAPAPAHMRFLDSARSTGPFTTTGRQSSAREARVGLLSAKQPPPDREVGSSPSSSGSQRQAAPPGLGTPDRKSTV